MRASSTDSSDNSKNWQLAVPKLLFFLFGGPIAGLVAAFTGLGGYALYEAHRRGTFNTVRPPRVGLMAGKAQAVIGFGELPISRMAF